MVAYDYLLQALPDCWSLDAASNARATERLEQALARDPDYALAPALLSWCHGQQVVYSWTDDPLPHKARAVELARRAAALDAEDPLVLFMLATAECIIGDVKAAAHHVRRGLDIDPNSAFGWNRSGYIHCYRGEPAAALGDFERARRLSPLDPMNFHLEIGIGLAHFVAGDYQPAIDHVEQALIENPAATWVHRLLSACLAHAGERERARRSVQIVQGYAPGITVDAIVAAIPHQTAEVRARYREGLLRAGFPE